MIENIQQFIERVHSMTKNRSREIRMTYEEANLLLADIAKLLSIKIEENQKDDPLKIIGSPLSSRNQD